VDKGDWSPHPDAPDREDARLYYIYDTTEWDFMAIVNGPQDSDLQTRQYSKTLTLPLGCQQLGERGKSQGNPASSPDPVLDCVTIAPTFPIIIHLVAEPLLNLIQEFWGPQSRGPLNNVMRICWPRKLARQSSVVPPMASRPQMHNSSLPR
jgi:hypothetical protein